jgi:peptidoglycan hydrolase-like protein with peptidoglycan-binding domain
MRFVLLAVLLTGLLGAGAPRAETPGSFYLRLLQQHLLLHGYDPGAADGDLTASTRLATARYRRDAQLPPDTDYLDVLSHLRYAAPRVMAAERRSSRHARPEVAAAQLLLVKLGHLEGPIDGRLGDETRAAVAAYLGAPAFTDDTIDARLLGALADDAAQRGMRVPSVIVAIEHAAASRTDGRAHDRAPQPQ